MLIGKRELLEFTTTLRVVQFLLVGRTFVLVLLPRTLSRGAVRPVQVITPAGAHVVVTPRGETLFVGMSPIRKRYLPFMAGRSPIRPSVEVFDVATGCSMGVAEVAAVAQIKNIYLVSSDRAERLLSCSPSLGQTRSGGDVG